MVQGLRDHLKFFQEPFAILLLFKFYLMPTLNTFYIEWCSTFFLANIAE